MRAAGAAALVAALVSLVVPSAATPTAPGRNGLIAFVVRNPQGGPAGIAVVGSDGRGFRQLTGDRRDRAPAWSPDGRRLAFERGGAIYVLRSDGRRLRRVARRSRGGRQPAWSPDGRALAFTRDGAVLTMRADGTGQRLVFRRRGLVANRPSWSPDGRRIAFGLVGGADEEETARHDAGSIVVVPRGGGRARYVTDGRVEPGDGSEPGSWAEDRGPDWSPDGTRIAFTRRVWLCPRCDEDRAYSVRADGFGVGPLADEWTSSPSWSPDGTLVVGVTAGGLAVFSAAGGPIRPLARLGSSPAWQPAAS